jgi:hypothetical protein
VSEALAQLPASPACHDFIVILLIQPSGISQLNTPG